VGGEKGKKGRTYWLRNLSLVEKRNYQTKGKRLERRGGNRDRWKEKKGKGSRATTPAGDTLFYFKSRGATEEGRGGERKGETGNTFGSDVKGGKEGRYPPRKQFSPKKTSRLKKNSMKNEQKGGGGRRCKNGRDD